jgi:hypothetical protein
LARLWWSDPAPPDHLGIQQAQPDSCLFPETAFPSASFRTSI